MYNKGQLLKALLLLLLVLALTIQTYRLQAAKNAHEATRLQHQQTLLNWQQAAQNEKELLLQRIQTQLEEKNESIQQLQTEVDHFAATASESDRVQRDLRARLRQAELAATTGSCSDAKEAARVCAELSGKLQTRAQALEQRASSYAKYADQLNIELKACSGLLLKQQ